jgi:NADPH:quinone reductase-like Zn-dependent oxidoreductase
MRAVRFHDYRGLSGIEYEDAPLPVPDDREVLVRVHAAGVNPFDWYAVEGYVNQYVSFPLPAVLGRDVSGIVEAIGAGVDGLAVGDAVYGQTDPESHGTFADYTAIDSCRVAKKPEHLTHVEAASLPNVLLAAWNGVFAKNSGANLEAGQTILIHGAAGGIGSIAIQLAKWRGAHVLGTASQGNRQFLLELGVDRAYDYTAEGWHDPIGRVDAVLNTADGGAAQRLCSIIKPGGRYVALRGLPDAAFIAERAADGVSCVAASGPASVKDFAQMAGVVAQGLIKPVVSAVYPIARFRDALERVRAGHVRGKLVLRVLDQPGERP